MKKQSRILVERERFPRYAPEMIRMSEPSLSPLRKILRSMWNLWAEAISDPKYIHPDEETRRMAAPR